MKKQILAAALVLAVVSPVIARAQMGAAQPTEGWRFGIGVGPTLPMGDYGKVDKLGFHGLFLVQMPIQHSPIHLRADLMFSQTSHKSSFGPGNSRIIGGTVDALYHFGDRHASMRPYILGGLGYFNVKESTSGISESKIGFGLGGGALFGLGASMHGFLEARYMSISTSGGSTGFIPITFGLMFGGS